MKIIIISNSIKPLENNKTVKFALQRRIKVIHKRNRTNLEWNAPWEMHVNQENSLLFFVFCWNRFLIDSCEWIVKRLIIEKLFATSLDLLQSIGVNQSKNVQSIFVQHELYEIETPYPYHLSGMQTLS